MLIGLKVTLATSDITSNVLKYKIYLCLVVSVGTVEGELLVLWLGLVKLISSSRPDG